MKFSPVLSLLAAGFALHGCNSTKSSSAGNPGTPAPVGIHGASAAGGILPMPAPAPVTSDWPAHPSPSAASDAPPLSEIAGNAKQEQSDRDYRDNDQAGAVLGFKGPYAKDLKTILTLIQQRKLKASQIGLNGITLANYLHAEDLSETILNGILDVTPRGKPESNEHFWDAREREGIFLNMLIKADAGRLSPSFLEFAKQRVMADLPDSDVGWPVGRALLKLSQSLSFGDADWGLISQSIADGDCGSRLNTWSWVGGPNFWAYQLIKSDFAFRDPVHENLVKWMSQCWKVSYQEITVNSEAPPVDFAARAQKFGADLPLEDATKIAMRSTYEGYTVPDAHPHFHSYIDSIQLSVVGGILSTLDRVDAVAAAVLTPEPGASDKPQYDIDWALAEKMSVLKFNTLPKSEADKLVQRTQSEIAADVAQIRAMLKDPGNPNSDPIRGFKTWNQLYAKTLLVRQFRSHALDGDAFLGLLGDGLALRRALKDKNNVAQSLAAAAAMNLAIVSLADSALSSLQTEQLYTKIKDADVIYPLAGYFYFVSVLKPGDPLLLPVDDFFRTIQPGERSSNQAAAEQVCRMLGQSDCGQESPDAWYTAKAKELARDGYTIPSLNWSFAD